MKPIAVVLRLVILVPDLLGTLSLAILDNRCQFVIGNIAWTSNERILRMKGVKVQLGDIQPDSDVGRIGLAAPIEEIVIKEVRKGRYYE